MGSNIAKEAGSATERAEIFHLPADKNNNDIVDRKEQQLALPAEVWASVMEFLPFDDILSCSATCRTILNDALPLLEILRIDKATQMNLMIASRFRDIREIHINSLLKVNIDDDGDGWTDIDLCMETKIRLIPFLSRFDKLDKLYFLGKDAEGDDIPFPYANVDSYFFEGDEGYPNEGSRDATLALLDNISGAFKCSALPTYLAISGLCCPDATNLHGMRSNDCATCIRACNSHPLKTVVEFESRGSSSNSGRSGRSHGLDVCLERAQIESIIESRPGGKALLRSNKRLLRLLGRGMRYKVTGDKGDSLHIVKYTQDELDDIQRVISYSNLDVKKLSMEKVSRAVMSSFAIGNHDLIVPTNQRYISEESLDYLMDKIGLPIDKEYFERPLADLMRHTQQFVWILNQCDHELSCEDLNEKEIEHHKDIVPDCVKLIRRFIEKCNLPIEQLSDDGILSLVHLLDVPVEHEHYEQTIDTGYILKDVLERGTHRQRKMMIDSGAIRLCSRHLGSTKDCVVEVAVLSLVEFVTRGTDDDIKNPFIICIPKLIKVLESKQDVCVEGSLRVLVAVKDHMNNTTHTASLLPHLIRLMKKAPGQPNDIILECAVLLRKLFDVDKPHGQKVIDLKSIPSLIEIMTEAEDETIRMNLEHAMISIAEDDQSSTWRVLVEEVDFLPVLISLVKSNDNAISEKAIEIAGSVADMTTEYRDLLLKAGIITPLLGVLKDSNTTAGALESTTSTLAKCCRGNLSDFATAKASLEVLTKLLSNDREAIVGDVASALFHILDDLAPDGVVEVVKDLGFVKQLLKLLPNAPHNLQHPALKSLHVVTTAGDECIKELSIRNGVARLSKVLSSSHENNQALACKIITNIISGNKDRLQIAIDNSVVPSLAQMMTTEGVNKTHALWCFYQMTKVGTVDQVSYLVNEGNCVDSLCDLLITDCNTSLMALWALKNILNAGKKNVAMSGVKGIESNLQELTIENLRLERSIESGELLKQKKAWLEYIKTNTRAKSLASACLVLEKQLKETDLRVRSLSEKVSCAKVLKLRKKEKNARAFLIKQKSASITEQNNFARKAKQLRQKAEEVVPKEELHALLSRKDLPENLTAINIALSLEESRQKWINAARKSQQRSKDLDEVKEGIEKLFKSVTIVTNKKKRKQSVLEDDDHDESTDLSKKKSRASTTFGSAFGVTATTFGAARGAAKSSAAEESLHKSSLPSAPVFGSAVTSSAGFGALAASSSSTDKPKGFGGGIEQEQKSPQTSPAFGSGSAPIFGSGSGKTNE